MSNGLDVALMKDPSAEWSPEHGDHHTDIAFDIDEWGSFFFNTLGAVEGEPFAMYDERRQITFQDSLKEYPLLSRIDDFYQDAVFALDEIRLLEFELKRSKTLLTDADARAFLEGMISACEIALAEKMGIRLLSS